MKRAAFIEFNLSHTECVYSHLLYLKRAGYHVEFICNDTQRVKVAEIKKMADKTTFIKVGQPYIDQNCKYIIEQKFDKVIIGSAFYNGDMDIVERISTEHTSNFYGVMHNIDNVVLKRFIDPKYRQYTSKISKYFVLADYIASNVPKKTGITCFAIPLIFQPEHIAVPIEKPKDEIWIAIPGALDFRRRDYAALIPPKGETYARNIKFILLGKNYFKKTTLFRDTLKKRGIKDNFVFFNKFVDVDEFESWIKKCDYVMPLIHEKCKYFKNYLRVKISGNLNVALTYRKPMLCDEAFSAIPEYAAHSLFYRREQLCSFVNGLNNPDIEKFYDEEFERTHSLEVLSERYNDFLQTK